jgi:zeaxanthin glucosyltransferase
MVAIPIGYDQPGVATRIAHHGAGEFLDVLTTPTYREKAQHFRDVIAKRRGRDVARRSDRARFRRSN